MHLDAHQHFWKYDPHQYPWMTDAMSVLRCDYLPAHLRPLLRTARFDGSIAVQARQTLEETDWLLELAEHEPLIRGVVGWVDLRSPDLRAQLARYASHPKLVGVRHVVHDEPDDRFMGRTDFRRGIAQLREFGLTYDLLLFPKHLRLAAQLAAEFPQQPFVLDHLAKPAIRNRLISPWKEDLERLAANPNVFCKLSGMVTEANWHAWTSVDFEPYLEVALAAFGPQRLMMGSDWPVCLLSGEYPDVLRIVMDHADKLSNVDREAVLGETCARFYGVADKSGA